MSRLLVIALLLSMPGLADARSHAKKHGHGAPRGKAHKSHARSAKVERSSARAAPIARPEQALTAPPQVRTAMVPQSNDDEVPGRRR